MTLLDRVILVTGASSGLGAHMAGFLASRGARVWIAARRVEALKALAEGRGGDLRPVEMDVARPESVVAAVARVASEEGRIDGLVNNAGIAYGGRAIETPDEAWQRVVDTNLNGAFTVAREVAKAMIAAGNGGSIVSTASILGFGTGAGVSAYAASKAAVVHLTRCLALEWARYGIRVNALAPGYVPTDINRDYLESAAGQEMLRSIPMRRFGRFEDLDGPLELLLSDAGGYITGVTLPVDGGHLVRPL